MRVCHARFCSVVVITPDFDSTIIPATPVRIWARPLSFDLIFFIGFGTLRFVIMVGRVIFSAGSIGARESGAGWDLVIDIQASVFALSLCH